MLPFEEIWAVDFEFYSGPGLHHGGVDGDLPTPLCMVALELKSGRLLRMWQEELMARQEAPFPVGPSALFLGYHVSAEFSCFLKLGWPLPIRVLDLEAEFRWLTSWINMPCGKSLLGALTAFSLPHIETEQKDFWRDSVTQGPPFTEEEKTQILDYCESDVRSLQVHKLPEFIGP